MKFLCTFQSKPGSPPPTPEQLQALGAFTVKYLSNGVVKMTGGILRAGHGLKLEQTGGKVKVVDGPYAETKELIDGYAIIEVPSQERAVEVCAEFMQVAGEGTGELQLMMDPPGF